MAKKTAPPAEQRTAPARAAKPAPPRAEATVAAVAAAPPPRRSVVRYVFAASLTVCLIAFAFQLLTTVSPLQRADFVCDVAGLLGPVDATVDMMADRFARADALPAAFGTAAYNRTMFWGTYRPNVLAGVRSREARPLLVGLGWFAPGARHEGFHDATDSDQLVFRWEAHDGRHFGRQVIQDRVHGLELVVEFLKDAGGKQWWLRVTGTRRPALAAVGDPAAAGRLVPYLYFALDHETGMLRFDADGDDAADMSGEVATVWGRTPSTGVPFRATVRSTCPSQDKAWNVRSVAAPTRGEEFKVVDPRRMGAAPKEKQPRRSPPSSKHNVVSLFRAFAGDFRIEVAFSELERDASPGTSGDLPASAVRLTPCQLHQVLRERESAFNRRFEERFPLLPEFASGGDVATLRLMARSSLANMIGGIGYWHGRHRVVSEEVDRRSDVRGIDVTNEQHLPSSQAAPPPPRDSKTATTLFSCVPSRAKFPRGFLWDEGFHQLLVAQWDADISRDIIAHWLIGAKDPATGWIPREQILGAESRSRVPGEFVAQHPTHANPPSLVLQVQNFALNGEDTATNKQFLRALSPHIRQWRDWFRSSQCGGDPANCSSATPQPLAFRWRSRNRHHLLASGLDDYPRPVCRGNHTRELHVDAFSWIAMMTATLGTIEASLGVPGAAATADEASRLAAGLEALHWDAAHERYADVTGCARPHFSPYVGYVSLFPFATLIVEDEARARSVVRLAQRELLTPFGLASLSNASIARLRDTKLAHDNYWTGPVWLNINFLFLRALKHKYVALVGSEAAELETALRSALVSNMAREFARTGKVWENYNQVTGKGHGTAPFTGWSALVVLMMSGKY